MKQEHPHAELLRAIADGGLDAAKEFEGKSLYWAHTPDWSALHGGLLSNIFTQPEHWQVRRKPRMIRIGDVEVQAGITEAPEMGTITWYVTLAPDQYAFAAAWAGTPHDYRRLILGQAHLTQGPATAMGKALAAITEHKNHENI